LLTIKTIYKSGSYADLYLYSYILNNPYVTRANLITPTVQ